MPHRYKQASYALLFALGLIFSKSSLALTNCTTTEADLLDKAAAAGLNIHRIVSDAIRQQYFIARAARLKEAKVAGGIYEIGAGGGTYELVTKAGDSSRVVIGTASDYSKTLSDALYGPVEIDGVRVYVHPDRVKSMVTTRLNELSKLDFEKSNEPHLKESRLFAFANTVGTGAGGRNGRGWLGIKTVDMSGQPVELYLYVQAKGDIQRQRDVMGELGVNVIVSIAANEINGKTVLKELVDGLTMNDVEIDVINTVGPIDKLQINLNNATQGLSQGFTISPDGTYGSASIFDYQQSKLDINKRSPTIELKISSFENVADIKQLIDTAGKQGKIVIIRR